MKWIDGLAIVAFGAVTMILIRFLVDLIEAL